MALLPWEFFDISQSFKRIPCISFPNTIVLLYSYLFYPHPHVPNFAMGFHHPYPFFLHYKSMHPLKPGAKLNNTFMTLLRN